MAIKSEDKKMLNEFSMAIGLLIGLSIALLFYWIVVKVNKENEKREARMVENMKIAIEERGINKK